MSRGRKKRHLIEREDVSAICDEITLHTTVFYLWQRRFFENGVRAFESDGNRPPRTVLPAPPPPMREVPPIALKEDYERGAKEPINP
jgi:hypothetical protein